MLPESITLNKILSFGSSLNCLVMQNTYVYLKMSQNTFLSKHKQALLYQMLKVTRKKKTRYYSKSAHLKITTTRRLV